MWERIGNVWRLAAVPCITVEPFAVDAHQAMWYACINGKPVSHIDASYSSETVRARAAEYFERRIQF